MQERIEIAGCLNAAQSVTTIGQRTGLHSGLGEVSMEQVLDWNPDILVINHGTPDEVYADPRWQQIQAVANRQVYPQRPGYSFSTVPRRNPPPFSRYGWPALPIRKVCRCMHLLPDQRILQTSI